MVLFIVIAIVSQWNIECCEYSLCTTQFLRFFVHIFHISDLPHRSSKFVRKCMTDVLMSVFCILCVQGRQLLSNQSIMQDAAFERNVCVCLRVQNQSGRRKRRRERDRKEVHQMWNRNTKEKYNSK